MLLACATAAALEITPTDLPDRPLLVWAETTDSGTVLRALPYRDDRLDTGSPLTVARHDGPLQPGPRITEDIVLLHAGEQRWWVDLPTGQATPLPDGVILRHSMRAQVVLQAPTAGCSPPPSPLRQS